MKLIISKYYCPLNHNSPIATPECKELGNIYSMDKPLYCFFFSKVLPDRNNVFTLLPTLQTFATHLQALYVTFAE